MKKSTLIALLLCSSVSAAPNGWIKQHKAHINATVQITLPVKQANLELVEKLFWEVSDPKSPQYAQYLSFEEVGKLVQNQKATQETLAFLQKIGISKDDLQAPGHGSYIRATVPVGLLDQIFGTDMHVYSHPEAQGREILKSERLPRLPKQLQELVTHVPHLSFFPNIRRKVRHTPILGLEDRKLSSAASSSYITPEVLSSFYGLDGSKVSHGASQSLFEALGQSYSNEDLNSFQEEFGLSLKNISKTIGPNTESACSGLSGVNDCGEANLDVQYIMAVAQGAYTAVWSISSTSNDPFLDWAEAVAASATPYQVHSMSYGGYEDNTSGDMTTFNTEVQKLGLQGVSVVVSSGDDGVANFEARQTFLFCGYNPSFPASSPYVTAVGATQGPEAGTEEVACSAATGGLITSGGGFSTVFSRPSYQASAVSAYFDGLSSSSKPESGYSTTGRGYPDVALAGYNYVIAVGGEFDLVSGTSAIAPVFAGMITLINDARLAKGKAPLGFLNQALYSLPGSTWNDVTSGNNKCTANILNCCSQGFHAASGWDPVTGLGSPKFGSLKEALVNL